MQYVDTLDVGQMPQQQQTRSKKKKHRDRSPQQLDSYPCFSSREREYLVSTGASSRHYIHETQSKAAHDPIPAIEEVGRYIEQAENRAKSVKDIARDLANDRAALAAHAEQAPPPPPPQSADQATADTSKVAESSGAAGAAGTEPAINPENIPPPPQQPQQERQQQQQANTMESSTHTLQTFNPQASTKAEVQLQQEHIQYVDNECCQVAVGVVNSQQAQQAPPGGLQSDHVTSAQQAQAAAAAAATLPRSRQPGQQAKSKTGTLNAAQMTTASQFATLERNMAEVAERNRQSRAELTNQNTLGRQSRYGDSCDTCDAPLTPASLAGIDHRDLEHRPLTRSVTRATVYDEPPER